jgi:hypothetical protein
MDFVIVARRAPAAASFHSILARPRFRETKMLAGSTYVQVNSQTGRNGTFSTAIDGWALAFPIHMPYALPSKIIITARRRGNRPRPARSHQSPRRAHMAAAAGHAPRRRPCVRAPIRHARTAAPPHVSAAGPTHTERCAWLPPAQAVYDVPILFPPSRLAWPLAPGRTSRVLCPEILESLLHSVRDDSTSHQITPVRPAPAALVAGQPNPTSRLLLE